MAKDLHLPMNLHRARFLNRSGFNLSSSGFLRASSRFHTVPRAAGTDDFRQILREELGSVRNELGSLKIEVGSLKNEVGSLKNEVGSVKNEVGSVRDRLNAMDRQLGSIVEHQARVQAEKMLGSDYQRPLLALSLQDVALLLPEEAVFRHPLAKESLQAPLGLAVTAARALAEEQVPLRLLRSIHSALQARPRSRYS